MLSNEVEVYLRFVSINEYYEELKSILKNILPTEKEKILNITLEKENVEKELKDIINIMNSKNFIEENSLVR